MKNKNTNRRNFIRNSALLAGAAVLPSSLMGFNIIHTAKLGEEIIGHADYRYRVYKDWGNLDPAKTPVKDCHEMVMDKKGRLIMITNETKNNIIIYDKSGKLLESWGNNFPGGHGLTIHDEGGEEFLYISDNAGKVCKTTLDGKILMTIEHPKNIGAYADCDKFIPTETAIGPNGDIYVADGYGSQYILQYDSKGEFIRKFGGDTFRDHGFKQVHGVAIDYRDKSNPILMCTDRNRNCFKRLTLDGKYISSIYLPGAYISRPVIDGDNLYSGVCFSATDHLTFGYQSGFVTILDKNNKVVSNPGGTKPKYKNGLLQMMVQESKVFIHCHDVCVDEDKDLYICQWNANKTYPVKLKRV